MQWRHELQLLTLASGMILVNFFSVSTAAASRRESDSDVRPPGGPGCVACQSSRDVPTLLQSGNDADDATKLGRPVGVAAGSREDPDRGRRRRRRRRQTETVELAETSLGQLLTLGSDYAERFAFKDPAPHQLDISAVMGNVLLRDGHRLDYETAPELEFVVIVTRVDDVACEYRCVVS